MTSSTLCIPRIQDGTSQRDIHSLFNKLGWGKVTQVNLAKSNGHCCVFININWYDTCYNIKERIQLSCFSVVTRDLNIIKIFHKKKK